MRRLALTLAIATLAAPARAGVEDTIGLGPRATALGGSYAARPGDFSACYYNPAGLSPGGPLRRGGFFELSLGAVVAHPQLHVTREGGGEIPTPEPADTAGAIVGARYSVGQPFGVDGLNMGLSVYAPKSLFRWTIRPDDDVQWAMLTDRTQVISVHTGLAYRITPWLSLGAGLRMLFDVQTLTRGQVTTVESDVDPVTGKQVVRTHTRLGTDAEVFGRVSPLFGALITPLEDLRIGLVYRHESFVDDWGNTRITGVPGLGNLGYTHRYAHYFEPTQVTLAVGARVLPELDVSADVTFNRWSRGLSTNQNFFGPGRFGDTWTPALGLRWQALAPLALLGGYRFVKSPLDNFGGPTNLLDNDRHVLSLGTELSLGADTSLTGAVSSTLLVERSEHKDFRRFDSDEALQDNPGYPGYSYGGHMLAASIGMEARW